MKLFHGSYLVVSVPQILAPARMLDFGAGFYTTTDSGQARNFTKRFAHMNKKRVMNSYTYDAKGATANLSVLTFHKADELWLRYVVANRSGAGNPDAYDIVKGPVANDRVYDVVEAFEIGDYSEDEAISRLMAFRLTDQVVFKSESSLRYLVFDSSEELGNDE